MFILFFLVNLGDYFATDNDSSIFKSSFLFYFIFISQEQRSSKPDSSSRIPDRLWPGTGNPLDLGLLPGSGSVPPFYNTATVKSEPQPGASSSHHRGHHGLIGKDNCWEDCALGGTGPLSPCLGAPSSKTGADFGNRKSLGGGGGTSKNITLLPVSLPGLSYSEATTVRLPGGRVPRAISQTHHTNLVTNLETFRSSTSLLADNPGIPGNSAGGVTTTSGGLERDHPSDHKGAGYAGPAGGECPQRALGDSDSSRKILVPTGKLYIPQTMHI